MVAKRSFAFFFLSLRHTNRVPPPNRSPYPLSLRDIALLAPAPFVAFGDSEKELAGAVLFLLNNEAASFITGVTLPIDGGFSAYSGV